MVTVGPTMPGPVAVGLAVLELTVFGLVMERFKMLESVVRASGSATPRAGAVTSGLMGLSGDIVDDGAAGLDESRMVGMAGVNTTINVSGSGAGSTGGVVGMSNG